MERTKYVYHILHDNTYTPIKKNYVDIDSSVIVFLKGELSNYFFEFSNTYAKIRIPESHYTILQALLAKYGLCAKENQFLTLIGAAQKTFIQYFEGNYKDDLFVDFEREYKETVILLDLLKKYLFEGDLKWLKTIKFDNIDYTPSTTSENLVPESSLITISNFFLVKDIYAAICDNWNLNKVNYWERRHVILEGVNNFKYKKIGLLFKKKLAKELYEFLYPDIIKHKNETYRFIGLFLMLSQINYKNISDDIELLEVENIDYNLKGIEHQYLQHLIVRDLSFYL